MTDNQLSGHCSAPAAVSAATCAPTLWPLPRRKEVRPMTRLLALSVFLAASSVLAQPAPPVPIPIPTSTDAGCLIQSDFRSGVGGSHHNFETVILQGHELVHYWRDNGNAAEGWVRGQVITSQATGPGCIIQSDFRSGDHGNFEVVVPEGSNLVHYFHDNSNVANPWRQAQVISTAATSAGSMIQSNFHSGDHGNFEVVLREGANLVHYFHDNSNVANPWQRGQTVAGGIGGSSAGFIQSDFSSSGHGNFEVVALAGNQV